jgi:alkylation response protein AidB-like acyl-CoA dehydrogenase
VLITAAAGTGIGYSTARRCLEEGATVFVSDIHERRLGEAVERLKGIGSAVAGGRVCDVTREADVRALVDGARTAADNIVGAPGEGWKIAMGTLAFERGVSTLAQQMDFRNELAAIVAAARANGSAANPLLRQRIAEAHIGLKIMRYSALRMLSSSASGTLSHEAYTYRLHWGVWRKKLGELAMDVLGPAGEIARAAPYELDELQHMFLFSRSDTIYGGTSQIQRNLIAERALGLPREPRGDT